MEARIYKGKQAHSTLACMDNDWTSEPATERRNKRTHERTNELTRNERASARASERTNEGIDKRRMLLYRLWFSFVVFRWAWSGFFRLNKSKLEFNVVSDVSLIRDPLQFSFFFLQLIIKTFRTKLLEIKTRNEMLTQ